MITSRTSHVSKARADWEELVPIAELDLHWTENAHAAVRVWNAPDGSGVAAFYVGVPLTLADAPLFPSRVDLPETALHLVLYAPEYEDGFDEALDAAFRGEVKITLCEKEPVHPEVAAVPMPEPAPAVTVPMTVTERDFDFLVGTSFGFDFEHFGPGLETYAPDKPPMADVDSHWEMVYVMDRPGSSYADIMLATAFLTGNGHPYELASTENEDDEIEWWLLTDFKTASWRRSDEMNKVAERVQKEAAEASGDELLQKYLMPSAGEEGASGE
ncbi:hypothetical protein [Streptomyces sp. NPDC086776]|uniref:hypothetical protein n=1 Tax=Streptomyces sp. NPDC086776 TaxID=3365756 RepID=UPI0038112E3D